MFDELGPSSKNTFGAPKLQRKGLSGGAKSGWSIAAGGTTAPPNVSSTWKFVPTFRLQLTCSSLLRLRPINQVVPAVSVCKLFCTVPMVLALAAPKLPSRLDPSDGA